MSQEVTAPIPGEAENEVAAVVENGPYGNDGVGEAPEVEIESERTELAPNLEAAPVAEIELPDKYKNEDGSANVQALLKSNLELEKVLHAPKPESEKPEGEVKIEPGADLEATMQKWADVIGQNDGVMSDEVAAEIAKAHNATPELAKDYWEGRQAIAKLHIMDIHALAGGAEPFDKMVTWAAKNLGLEQANQFIDNIDAMKRAGRDAELKVTMDGMVAQWKAATGTRWVPEITGRDAAGEAIQPFANRQEMSDAQNSKEYQSGDEAYHRVFDRRHALSKQRGIF